MPNSPPTEDLSVNAELEIDAICEQVEEQLRLGQQPDITNIVNAAPVALRGKLSVELQKLLAEHKPRSLTQPGLQLGPYTLERLLGEGGMGEVWVAQQQEPVRRQVAVKLIKPGMDSQTVLARFEQERQALAHLEHPNIARILDAGLTPQQRPYFVMEYLDGQRLNHFCDHHKLDVPARLKLFLVLANAIHFAHQKGIIHRDLKPSNILVTQPDGQPLLKVIDFGVAKLLQNTPGDDTYSTQPGSIIGTWEYMAPEQAGGTTDLDIRADIYSLGVILYELLCGSRPFDSQRLRQTPWDQVLRIIREEDPPHPSTQLSNNPQQGTVADSRSTTSRTLRQQLQGDLDWIIMKCLEKDRSRRYDSAANLRADVERYLAHEPIEARPPSKAYRVQKFIRRNQLVVLASGLVALSLLAAGVALAWGYVEAKKAEAKAKQALKEVTFANDTVFDVFTDLDIRRARQSGDPLEMVLVDRLLKASKRLTPEAMPEANTRLRLQHRLAVTLLNLDRPRDTIPIFQQVREALLESRGPDDAFTLECTTHLAEAYRDSGQAALAMPLYEEVHARTLAQFGPDEARTLNSLSNVASGHMAMGDPRKALPLYEQVHHWRMAHLGEADEQTLLSMNNLAACFTAAGQPAKSVPLYDRAWTLRREKLGADNADTLVSLNNLASALQDAGDLPKALPLMEQAVELHRAKFGENHRQTLTTMGNLAYGYRKKGRLPEAIDLLERTVNLRRAKLGADHPDTLLGLNNLAFTLQEANQLGKAISIFEETLELQKGKYTTEHPDTLLTMNNLASAYHSADQVGKAVVLYEAALKILRGKFGPTHPQTTAIIGNLAVAYVDAKQGDKAALLFDEFVQIKRGLPAFEESKFAGTLQTIGNYLLSCDQPAAAENHFRNALVIRQRHTPGSWTTFNTQVLLGRSLFLQQKYQEAEEVLSKGYDGLRERRSTLPASSANAAFQAGWWLMELHEATYNADGVARIRESLPPEVAPTPKRKK